MCISYFSRSLFFPPTMNCAAYSPAATGISAVRAPFRKAFVAVNEMALTKQLKCHHQHHKDRGATVPSPACSSTATPISPAARYTKSIYLNFSPLKRSYTRNKAIFLGLSFLPYVCKLIQNPNSFSELNCQPPTQAETLALTA